MRRLALLLFASTAICTVSQAQVGHLNKTGVPFTTVFKPNTSQTLDIIQDHRGLMYFANDDGIFEYDGIKISKWPLLYTQSLSVDEDNIVRVGASDDFGYLYPNETGMLEYVSLASKVPDSIAIDNIYKTYSIGNRTYYCSLYNIFIVEKDSIVKIVDLPENSFWAYPVGGDTLFIGNMNEKGDEAFLYYDNYIHYTDLSLKGGVYGIIPSKNGKYYASTGNKLFEISFDGELPKDLRTPNKAIDCVYKKHMPYGLALFGDSIVMPTVFDDKYNVAVFDKNLNFKLALNNNTGLGSSNAFVCYPSGHLLWVGLDNCIAKVELGNSFYHFGQESGLNGAINDINKIDGKLYVSTNGGLFREDFDEYGLPSFKRVYTYAALKTIKFKVPNSNKSITLAGTALNVIELKNGEVRLKDDGTAKDEIKHIDGYALFQSVHHPEFLYIGSKEGLLCYEYKKDGDKNWNEKFEAFQGAEVSAIDEDANGNIWCVTSRGIYKMTYDGKTLESYDEENGIPSLIMTMVKNIGGKMFFFTEAGVYELDENSSQFELSDYFGSVSTDTTHGILDIKPYKDMFVASCHDMANNKYWITLFKKDNNGLCTIVNDLSFAKPTSKQKGSLYFTYIDDENNLWLSLDDELLCYNPNRVDPSNAYYNAPFDALIRQVLINDTTVLFGGTFTNETEFGITTKQPESSIIELPYSNNSLTFNFTSNFYDGEDQTEYSTMLVGDDKSWSRWKKSTEYSRMHLSEGRYTFMVKARNIYGIESSVAEYTFIINPPFYRTIVAYILYVILLVVLVYGIVKWNTRRLIEEKKKLEQKIAEATEEIRGQNVQLEQQKDEIEKQKDEIQASINYARRIQRALLTPDETIDKIFPDHFLLYKPRNVVSGDYYWFGQFGDNKVSIVADCTGHGVPGGFMSMLGMTNLNYIVGQELRPDEILNKLRNAIITSLRQKDDAPEPTGDEKADRRAAFAATVEKKDRSQDGMDVAMYVINEKEMTLSFAGANNPLVLIRDGEVQVIKASKMPVGIYAKLDPFERVDMELKKGDCLYTFSDGFQDQFGYESGKKFMSKHLREVLLEIHQKPMAEQKEILNKTYEDWRGPADHQTDDVVLMGVRIN